MLQQLLRKLGVKNYSELNELERVTFDTWSRMLTQQELTVESIQDFVANQKENYQRDAMKYDNSKEKDLFLKAVLRVLTSLDVFLTAKDRAKEVLSKQLSEKFDLPSNS
jgi:hypothetical protein